MPSPQCQQQDIAVSPAPPPAALLPVPQKRVVRAASIHGMAGMAAYMASTYKVRHKLVVSLCSHSDSSRAILTHLHTTQPTHPSTHPPFTRPAGVPGQGAGSLALKLYRPTSFCS